MNQQRSRRFRASKEGAELQEEKTRIREEIIGRGVCVRVCVRQFPPGRTELSKKILIVMFVFESFYAKQTALNLSVR